MKAKSKLIIPIILLFLFSSLVLGAYTITRNSPGDYSVENSTTVTFDLNVSGGSNVSMNCSVYYNTDTSVGQYGNFTEASLGSFTNNTDSTGTATFSDGARVWWKIGCYDTVGGTAVTYESATVVANNSQIDLTYDTNTIVTVAGIVQLNATDNVSMVEGTDWSLVNNLLIVNSSTYEGNTSYWNYSWPGTNKVNEVNTTVKVMDIDDDYWDYLNISLPISVPSIVIEPTLALPTCVAGRIAYNTTNEHFFGCINNTEWVQLDN